MTPTDLEYRIIELTQNQVALVDVLKYDEINSVKWCARWSEAMQSYYAIRGLVLEYKKPSVTIYMHRQILGLSPFDPRKGDHIDPASTLDNRLSNLRIASNSQNCMNRRKYSNNTSGRKGVDFHKGINKWRARIMVGGVNIELGSSEHYEVACALREAAEKKYHGEFARSE